LSATEKRVLLVFVMTACGWIFRLPIDTGLFRIPGITDILPQVTDATIAVMAAVVLFFLPAGKRTRLLEWKDVQQNIPWGILLLFGGGFSLAEAMRRSGVTLFLGGGIENLGIIPVFLIIALVCLLLSFLTELTSNTATANILLPVLASASVALGHHPLLLALPAALNASFAFMLPVATPPNAVVFSTSLIGIRTMAATGLTFNFLGVLLVTMMMYLLGLHVFDITIASTPAWVH
jgi:sodium-dependent dicarboxylate transporter 2/3/5